MRSLSFVFLSGNSSVQVAWSPIQLLRSQLVRVTKSPSDLSGEKRVDTENLHSPNTAPDALAANWSHWAASRPPCAALQPDRHTSLTVTHWHSDATLAFGKACKWLKGSRCAWAGVCLPCARHVRSAERVLLIGCAYSVPGALEVCLQTRVQS